MPELNIKQSLRQGLYLSARMEQSMRILQATTQELEAYLAELVCENPALEAEEREFFRQETLLRSRSARRASGPRDAEDEPPAPETPVWDRETLTEHLERQLALRRLSAPLHRTCRYLAGLLQSDGYLLREDIEDTIRLGVPEELCRRAVEVLQSLDPPGVAAEDLRRCLLLQLDRLPRPDPLARALAEGYLEPLGKHRYGEIARKLRVSKEQVMAAEELLRSLEPRPGAPWDEGEEPTYICPDLVIRAEGLQLQLETDERYLPRVAVSDYYTRLWRETEDEETRQYLKRKLAQANWVVSCLERRQETLRRCGEAILELQRGYFTGEETGLRPMTLADVAERMGVHPSTVSRCIRGKYLQSPRGTVPLRRLFSPAVGSGGASAEAARQEIARLIRAEDGERPFSDGQLCALLQAKGIAVARRTVAKYRESLHIPPASERRSGGRG